MRPGETGRLLAILVSLYAVAYLDRSIIALVAPALQADLGITATQLALLQGLGFVLFYAVLGLPLGALVDRVSRRGVIFCGVLVWSVAASLGGLSTSFSQLLLTRLGVGAGEAALSPAGYSMVADSAPRSRLAFMSAIFSSGAGIGSALSVLAGGVLMTWAVTRGGLTLPLIGQLAPWQAVLFLTGLPGLFLAPLIFLVREPPRRDRLSDQAVGWRQLAAFVRERRSFFTLCFAGIAIWQAMVYSANLWIPSRFVKEFGWRYADVGFVMAAITLCQPVAGVAFGRLTSALVARGRLSAPLAVSAVCSIVSGVAYAAAFMAPQVQLFVLFLLVAFVPTIPLALGATAVQMVSPNQYRGRLIALYTFVTTLSGAGLGPLLPALLSDGVFADEAMISESVAIVCGITGPLAAVLLLAALRPMSRAVTQAETWQSEPE